MEHELREIAIYTQTNPEKPIRIVASINRVEDGSVCDWAAYIGCGGQEEVWHDGEKLLDRWAAGFFPDLPIEKYRE
jgi:hypothetical protein